MPSKTMEHKDQATGLDDGGIKRVLPGSAHMLQLGSAVGGCSGRGEEIIHPPRCEQIQVPALESNGSRQDCHKKGGRAPHANEIDIIQQRPRAKQSSIIGLEQNNHPS
jgi:hypothetical protein